MEGSSSPGACSYRSQDQDRSVSALSDADPDPGPGVLAEQVPDIASHSPGTRFGRSWDQDHPASAWRDPGPGTGAQSEPIPGRAVLPSASPAHQEVPLMSRIWGLLHSCLCLLELVK